jgi:hypothetical protein
VVEKHYFIACINLRDNKPDHFQVTEDVYVYVKQLEAYIKNPKKSKLLTVYKNLARHVGVADR